MTLGEKITRYRKKKGLSQVDLADQVGVTRDTIGKYERDDMTPTVDKAKKIADACGVSLDFLMNEKEEQEKAIPDKDMASRVGELYKLSELDRDKILSSSYAILRPRRRTLRKAYYCPLFGGSIACSTKSFGTDSSVRNSW